MTARTKIVATIGPASWSRPVLRQLIEAGVDVFRLNFSHGTHEEHSGMLSDIRTLSRELECVQLGRCDRSFHTLTKIRSGAQQNKR